MRKFLILIQFIISSILIASAVNVSQHYTFSRSSVELSPYTHLDTTYCEVRYSGFDVIGTPGYPALPKKIVKFAVPLTATNISVSTTLGRGEILPITQGSRVLPIQEESPMNMPGVFTYPNAQAYAQTAYPSTNHAEIIGDGLYMGQQRIITVAICPFKYMISTGLINFYTTIELNISYDNGASYDGAFTPISRQQNISQQSGSASANQTINSLNGIVDLGVGNEDLVPEHYPLDSSIKGYVYTIVTCDSLASAFDRLVAMRKQQGIQAGVVTMEQIRSHEAFAAGDVISRINDDAGKLRAYLTYAFEHCDTKYVLLAGKDTNVPVKSYHPLHHSVPTDWYFAELNSDWSTAILDYCPELYVGRITCSNRAEINDYLDKLEIYEFLPGGGDLTYLGKCLNHIDYIRYNYELEQGRTNTIYSYYSNEMNEAFDNVSDCFNTKTSPNGNGFMDLWRNSKTGYLTFHGHGGPTSITLNGKYDEKHTNCHSFGLMANAFYDNQFEDQNNHIQLFANKKHPFIAYAISCDVMPFDHYYTSYAPYDGWNFGETLIFGKDYGAVAFLSNTRSGYFSTSSILEKYFYVAAHQSASKMLGELEAESKFLFSYDRDNSEHVFLTHNLLGEPCIKLWAQSPATFTGLTQTISGYSKTITHPNLSGSTVCVRSVNRSQSSGSSNLTPLNEYRLFYPTSNTLTIPDARYCMVTIVNDDYLPYICPLDLSSGTLNGHAINYVSTLNIGTDQSSTIVLSSNCSQTYIATGDVRLGSNFCLRTNSTLNIRTKGKVTFEGTTLQGKSKINIECSSFESTTGTALPAGVNVSINEF